MMRFSLDGHTFTRPGDYYICVAFPGQTSGPLEQICHGGALRGAAIGYSGDDPVHFEMLCRCWYAVWRRNNAPLGRAG